MCELVQFEDRTRGGKFDWAVNRRLFTLGTLGVLAACATGTVGAGDLTEERVRVATPDGTMDAFFVRPTSGRHPAILTWPDIAGLREAFEVMARRLAGQGYAVLVVNPYYRNVPAPQFRDFSDFQSQGGFEKVGPWRSALNAEMVQRDASAAIRWLDSRPETDNSRGIGTHGYCMGGPFTVWTAAAVPDRVRAAASLHGGGLVKPNDPKSPHNVLDETEASYLFAIAQDDDEKAPEVKTALRGAAMASSRRAEVEVYPAKHGWTVIDSPAYDPTAAERAWERMSALFSTL